MRITDKQKIFCRNYANTLNATQSYMKAYRCKEATARKRASELLSHEEIQDAISQLKREKAKKYCLNQDDIISKCLEILSLDITDFLNFGTDKEGKIYLNPKDSNKINGKLIQEVKKTRDGITLKFPDKMKALEILSKFVEPDNELDIEEKRAKIEYIKAQTECLKSKQLINPFKLLEGVISDEK